MNPEASSTAIDEIRNKAKFSREAALKAALTTTEIRKNVVEAMAEAILAESESILSANAKDMEKAELSGVDKPLQDRLLLTSSRIAGIAAGLHEVAQLPDQLGNIESMQQRPNGLLVGKMRVPIGVVGMIYEARPNVTADAAGLCVKSGNTVILRGGSLANHSNIQITRVLHDAAVAAGYPKNAIQSIETTDRAAVREMLQYREYIDVVIPRGGAQFIKDVVSQAKVPVIETGAGNCHTYVHEDADLNMALDIIYNGKVQRPSVCNATKKILIHQDVASELLPKVATRLGEAGVVFLTDNQSQPFFPNSQIITEEEWGEEFLDMRLGVGIVESLDAAINHINRYGSRHTEVIVSASYTRALTFINAVDAASVLWNASSRFTDGSEFGLGAEIGISTQKLHARGPMGIEALTTTKWVTLGTGQIRK